MRLRLYSVSRRCPDPSATVTAAAPMLRNASIVAAIRVGCVLMTPDAVVLHEVRLEHDPLASDVEPAQCAAPTHQVPPGRRRSAVPGELRRTIDAPSETPRLTMAGAVQTLACRSSRSGVRPQQRLQRPSGKCADHALAEPSSQSSSVCLRHNGARQAARIDPILFRSRDSVS
jgi:hypothetical protein